MYLKTAFGEIKSVLIRDVSLIQVSFKRGSTLVHLILFGHRVGY